MQGHLSLLNLIHHIAYSTWLLWPYGANSATESHSSRMRLSSAPRFSPAPPFLVPFSCSLVIKGREVQGVGEQLCSGVEFVA